MAADYRKFKTPFYEITVGDPSWKRTAKLPHHILRLVEKVEIIENMMVDDHTTPSSISITFVEGSREPASPDYRAGTSGLYQVPNEGEKVDLDIAGSLTNRSGLITDLRFSGAHGITFLTDKEKKEGKVDNTIQKNVVNNDTTRKYKYEDKAPLFLFQERNKIKVTWGYLEDRSSVRSVMMIIQVVNTEFPQEGMPRTTITGLSFTSLADQTATKKAVVFGERKITSKANDSIIDFKDVKTDALIKKIAKDAGMAAIVSTNLPYDVIDGHQKMWLAGESFHQFMKKLAANSGCYYEILLDPTSGKETIIFIKYADFEKNVIVSDKELLHWKGPGSILKSITVNADFGGMLGTSNKTIDENGNEKSVDDGVGREVLTQYNTSVNKKEQAVPTDPTGNNANPAAKGISEKVANGGTTGIVDNSPATSQANIEDRSKVLTAKNAKMIHIDFNTIGYTKLIPGVMEIAGIGIRYSGKYRVISVTHSIDSSGYSCRCSGMSQMVASGGVALPTGTQSGDDFVAIRVLNVEKTSSTFGDDQTKVMDEYKDNKFKQSKQSK
jgi:hypothetical protein